ncbi:hypothetical protein SOVF_100060 [Spinacia oleracea]|nr:hypothetical protein SOVF_100060 [Spinacia oleracea]
MTWKATLVRERFEWKDAKDILAMELPQSPKSDFIFWKAHPSGNFITKSGYAMLVENRIKDEDRLNRDTLKVLGIVWKDKILPKWKVFMWRLMFNGLAVNSNLSKRGIEVGSQCEYCGYMDENIQHVFQTCSVARLSWMVYKIQVQIETLEPINVKKWVQNYILLFHSEDGSNGSRIEGFIAMLWSLWVTRNARVFRKDGGHARTVLQQVEVALRTLSVFQQSPHPIQIDPVPPDSEPREPPGFLLVQLGSNQNVFANFVLQVDGSWDKKTKRAGWGWAYKDGNMEMVVFQAGGGDYGCTSTALQAETRACLRGLQWAKERNIMEILVFTDSLILVSELKKQSEYIVHVTWEIQEIRKLAATFNVRSILKTDRNKVEMAHVIANKCRKDGSTLSFRM